MESVENQIPFLCLNWNYSLRNFYIISATRDRSLLLLNLIIFHRMWKLTFDGIRFIENLFERYIASICHNVVINTNNEGSPKIRENNEMVG